MDVLSWRLRSHQLIILRIKRNARVRWESPERGQRQPLFGCRRQRDKTLNEVSNLGHGFIQAKVRNKSNQPR